MPSVADASMPGHSGTARPWASGLWCTLQRIGQRRAAAGLYALAGQHARTAPTLARELNAAAAECLRASNQHQRN